MDQISGTLLTIFTAFITLAIVSVFVGSKSRAGNVIQSASGGLAQIITAAVTPVASANTPSIAGSTSNPAANALGNLTSTLGSSGAGLLGTVI